MRTTLRRQFAYAWLIAAAMAALAGASPGSAAADPVAPPIGKPAPAFSLSAADGGAHTLSRYTGKTVVLLWLNRACPYCERILNGKLVQKAIRDAKAADKDVIWLIVNSTRGTDVAENVALARDYDLRVPILIDADGAVAQQYGARMTPQTMVIDPKGMLIYSGAFDNDPNGARAEKSRPVKNHAVDVVTRLAKGDAVKPESNRPYGCRIKFTDDPG